MVTVDFLGTEVPLTGDVISTVGDVPPATGIL
jgi:hypothetical protein